MQDYGITLPDGYHNFTKIESSNFSYRRIETGENIQRSWKIFYPNVTTPFTTDGNRIIRFELPTDGNYDFTRGWLKFNVAITHPAGTPTPGTPVIALPNGFHNLFQRARHFSDTQLIEELNDYGRVVSFIWVTRQYPPVADKLGTLVGFNTITSRQALGLTNQECSMGLKMGFINAGIMPLHAMPKQYLELHLADPTSYLETNWTANTVTVSNMEWHYEKISGIEYHNRMWNLVQTGRFRVHFDTWQTYQNVNIGTVQDLTIAVKNNIFSGVFSVFINTNDTNNMDTSPYYQKFFQWPKLTIHDYQYRIAGEWWPELPVDCTGQGRTNYFDYANWVDGWKFDAILEDTPNMDIDEFNGVNDPDGYGSFVIMGDFSNDPGTGLLNNLSTRKLSPDLQIRLRLDSAPAAGTALLSFIKGSTIVHVPPCRQQLTVIT
jgi:hypothetical protein